MRLPRSSFLISIAAFMLCCLARSAAAQAQEDLSRFLGNPIHSVRYQADHPIERARYDPILGLKAGDILTRSGIKEAIQSLYRTGDFAEIFVDAEPEGAAVRLTLHLRLNYYFNDFTIRGGVDLHGRGPSEVIPLPVGERFSEKRREEARQAVISYLRERGYFQAKVDFETRQNPANRQVDVEFGANPGIRARVATVEIQGVPPADVFWIQEKLKITPGLEYDREALRRRIENLRQEFLKRGYLEAGVAVQDAYDSTNNSVRLAVTISNYGRVRVAIEGFDVPRDQWRRLLPILSGGNLDSELLQEGLLNLRQSLEERGYPAADVTVSDERGPGGVRTIQYRIEPGDRVTVVGVRFRGNAIFSTSDLQAAIQIEPSHLFRKSTYSRAKLDADVESLRSLYGAAGYLDTQIIPLPEQVGGARQIRVTFEISEGPQSRVEEVGFKGNQILSAEFLRAKLSLQPGGAYSPHRAEKDRQALLAAYNDAGFTQPRIVYNASETTESKTYRVEFLVEEGPRSLVGNILVLGNRRTRDAIINSRIKVRKEEPLSLGRMLETQQALYNTGIFERVRVGQQNPESTAPYQDVVVRLEESKQIITGYALGYHEREKLRGTFEFRHLNLFGTGRAADIRLRGSRLEKGIALSLQQPRLIPIPLESYFTLSANDKKEVSFDARRVNLSVQFADPINNHSWVLLRYGFRNVRVSNLKISPSELAREDVERNLSTISAIYVNDTRDNFVDAEKGFFTSTNLSFTAKAFGSNNNFLSLFSQNTYHRKLARPFLLAASLQFGTAHPFGEDTSIPISERYFAGGSSSLRGFETDLAGPLDADTGKPLGGNALLIANLEFKIPFFKYLQLAGFYDTGNVFRRLKDIRLADFSHTLGVGLRLKTPLGPVRLDYGFNMNLPDRLRAQRFSARQLHVTIGPPF